MDDHDSEYFPEKQRVSHWKRISRFFINDNQSNHHYLIQLCIIASPLSISSFDSKCNDEKQIDRVSMIESLS